MVSSVETSQYFSNFFLSLNLFLTLIFFICIKQALLPHNARHYNCSQISLLVFFIKHNFLQIISSTSIATPLFVTRCFTINQGNAYIKPQLLRMTVLLSGWPFDQLQLALVN